MVAVLAAELILSSQFGCASRRTTPPESKPAPAVFDALQEDLKKPYVTLFETAAKLEYSESQIRTMREYLTQAEDYCAGRFKDQSKSFEAQIEKYQDALKASGLSAGQRQNLHCNIQNARILKSEADVIAGHAIPVAYDNRQAKLDVIQRWPTELQTIRRSIADGTYRSRRWGDVQDIGYRKLEPDQKDDIKLGREAIRDIKQSGMMPKEIEDEVVVAYVKQVAQKVAANSDLLVPLQVTVLNSKEINAFALPGGFIFIERGLLEAADDESQLAGVIAHELSHAAARHGRKLMTKATIASIMYQAAQVTAMILTGGVAGIGTYYALQYGFYGLGLTLNLSLLGVSREFELQADQLGIQYAWKAGYDPSGFVRFFDKMATSEGYVNGVSWFRSHPPFYQRMVDAEREISYLPKPEHSIVTTTDFAAMKASLRKVSTKADVDSKKRPSLVSPEQSCPPPSKLIFEPDQPIETICSSPQIRPAPALVPR